MVNLRKVLKAFFYFSIFFLSPTLFTKSLFARKFDFKTEHLSSYFSLELSKPRIKNKAFESYGDPETSLSKEYKALLGTALGFIFKASEWVNINLGFNLSSGSLSTKGYNGEASIEKFKLKSRMLILNPNLGLEIKLYRSEFQRFYLFMAGGWSHLYLENKYEFSEEGRKELHLDESIKELKENLVSHFISKRVGLGWETLLVDIATVFLGIGYDQRSVKKLSFKESTITLSNNKVDANDQAKYQNGNVRQFDLSNFFVYLGFRFYLF